MDGYSALDRLDLRILAILQADGRITNQALAEKVALSPSACLARVRRLEADGLILGYHARLDIERIRPTVTIYGDVTLKSHRPADLAAFEAVLLDIPEVEGVAMPKPHDFLSAEQRDGSVLQAQEIYTETWQWLKSIGCAAKVSPQLLERYAMCSARWVQCEEMTNRMGFLSKHPTTGKPIPSPFINIGINYMNQAVRLWNEIFQIVKENCSTEYGESTPQDDLMERLLRARKG